MKNVTCILWIFFAIAANSDVFGITLTKQEQKNIRINLELFLTALQSQPSLVFEPTTSFDLRGVDLHERNFMNAIITNVNLSGANLSGVNIMAAKLTNVNLTGANLSGAKANNTRFWQCNLTNAIFTDAEMQGIQIIGTQDNRVQARNLIAVGTKTNISNGAQFTHVDLSGANMTGCNFHWSVLSDIIIDNTTNFRGSDFSRTQLIEWPGYKEKLKTFLLNQSVNLTDATIDGLSVM